MLENDEEIMEDRGTGGATGSNMERKAEDGVDAQEESQPMEARAAVAVKDPMAPSAAAKAEHDLHHANFRS